MIFRSVARMAPFRRSAVRLVISSEDIPRKFPIKATTGLAGLNVEPLWKPKLLASAAELKAYMEHSDIPKDSTFYNVVMVLPRRIFGGIEDCGDDWCTLEKKYFWGWPVEMILNVTWKQIDCAQKWNEWRFWELDVDQLKKLANDEYGYARTRDGHGLPWDEIVRKDYDKRKQALSQEEMAELKRMDTEKMARETRTYKERKERIKDDMERARGDMLKKFLNKRIQVDHDLKRMQPGKVYNRKTGDDIIEELTGEVKMPKEPGARPQGDYEQPTAQPGRPSKKVKSMDVTKNWHVHNMENKPEWDDMFKK